MLEETATVVNADNEHIWLQVEKQSACGQCSVNKGCGTSILAAYFNRYPEEIKLPNTHKAKTGDQVLIGLPENAILKGSMLVYLFPILGILFGALLGQYLAGVFAGASELYSIVLGLAGFFVGAKWAKHSVAKVRNYKTFQPVLIKIL